MIVSVLTACGAGDKNGANTSTNSSDSTADATSYLSVDTAAIEGKQLSAIENTKAYTYQNSLGLEPEAVARKLAVLFMDDLKNTSDERTFRITAYKDLDVALYHTTELTGEISTEYCVIEDEISENKWIVEIAASFQYEGSYAVIGPSGGNWYNELYQGSRVGFLMTKEGNTYTLQSRYNTASGLPR